MPSAAMSRVLFEQPYVLLTYDETNQWLHVQWRGCLTLEMVRTGSEQVLAQVRAHRHSRLLNDNTQVTQLNLTEKEQTSYQILTQLFEAGLHYLAWVYAPVPGGRTYAETSIAAAGWPLMLSFEEYSTAADWLREVS